ncbi:MAG: beta-phosphoglucomutase [Balneolaceae bacterium]|nr:beta-phosphoglucomutase [Balneolaceae bacterium]
MPEINACIFDLDGVIVDTAKYHFKGWQRLAGQLGIEFTLEDNEELKGVSRRESLNKILEMGDKSVPEGEKKGLTDRKNEWYRDYISHMSPDEILEGVKPFMDELKNRDIKVGVGSSSKNTPYILKAIGLSDYFDAVVDGNMVEHTKPHPEVFLKGADRMDVDPQNCVVFEDAVSGVQAARRAGMMVVGVGEQEVLDDADLVIPGFANFSVDDLIEEFVT